MEIDHYKKIVELLTELERKEKEAGIVPDPEVSYFMKVLYLVMLFLRENIR